MQNDKFDRRALNETEAAHYIAMSVSFLRHDRMDGKLPNRTPGPAYVKVGRTVRYLIEDLDAFLDQHRQEA